MCERAEKRQEHLTTARCTATDVRFWPEQAERK